MAKGWGIVQDSQGNAIEDCVVKVYLAGTSTLASIFSDSALSVAIDQVNAPVETDETGHYQFFIASGSSVKLVGTKGTFTFTEDNVDIGFSVPAARLVSTTSPLTGGGDLSADRTLGFDAFVDVRAYGAVGDGVADNTAEIQAAVNALGAAGGGALFIPSLFQFNVSSAISVPATVIVFGSGYGSHIHQTSADTEIFNCSGSHRVGFHDLRLTGQGGYTTPGRAAIHLGDNTAGNGSDDSWVTRVWIEGVSNCGIIVDSKNNRNRISNCYIEGVGEEGVYLLGTDSIVSNCHIVNSGEAGIKCAAHTNPLILGNHIEGSGHQGINVDGNLGVVSGALVSGNIILRSWFSGIRLAGTTDGVSVVGNYIEASSQQTDNVRSGIRLDGSSATSLSKTYIAGNVIRQGSETNKPKYGIELIDGQDTILGENDLRDSGKTGQLFDGATNTQGVTLAPRAALASSDATINSTSATDIPGASISVTPLHTQKVVVNGEFDCAQVGSGSNLILQLDVNGVAETHIGIFTQAARLSTSMRWVLTLTGGTAYTIKLQAKLNVAAGSYTVRGGANTTQISMNPARQS